MDIEISGLCKSYFLNQKEIPVLRDLSLSIKAGERIALSGPSGAGKSTFLHVLGTLDSPSSGNISYDHHRIFSWKDARVADFRNRNIAHVFQFHHLLGEFTALENVQMPLLMRREKKIIAERKALEMLDFVGLYERQHHKPGELSGGEQQRVALARALAQDPKLLLADEPTGNLDEKTGRAVIDLIVDFSKKNSATVLLVTHNQAIFTLFERQLVLQDGSFRECAL
jgi:lipoprotein-releasing system ATP-binding protein